MVRATLALAPELPPDRDVVAPDGTRHTVWCVPRGPQADELCRELGGVTHYIADGHHRVAASLEVWARSGRDSRRGVLCVAYPLDGLRLAAIDRRVAGPVDACLVRSLLEASFVVRPVADAREALSTGVAVTFDRRWYAATYAGERPAGSPGLDVSLLHAHVLDRLPAGTVVEPTRDPIEDLARGVRRRRRRAVRAARTGADDAHRDRRRARGGSRQEHLLLPQARIGHLPARSRRWPTRPRPDGDAAAAVVTPRPRPARSTHGPWPRHTVGRGADVRSWNRIRQLFTRAQPTRKQRGRRYW